MTEISDYLRPTSIRWLLAGVLTVVVVAMLVFVSSPPEELLRTVAVVGPDHYADSANDRIDFIRNLQAAAETTTVLEEVADESGLTVDQVTDRLKVQRVESSNLVKITYESTESDPAVAKAVVLTVPEAAVAFLRTTRIEEAAARLEQATKRADDATAAVVAAGLEVDAIESEISLAVSRNGNIRPDVAFDALQSELSSLRIRRAGVDAEESPVVAEQLSEAIAELESGLTLASVRSNNFTVLIAEQDAAARAYDKAVAAAADADSAVEEAVIEYDLAISPPTVSLEKVEEETGQLWPGLRRYVAIGVAALVFVIAALVAWNLVVVAKRHARGAEGTISARGLVGGGSKPSEKTSGKGANPRSP